jgi:hypothetical protein
MELDKIICPWCEKEIDFEHIFEDGAHDGDDMESECYHCGKPIEVRVNVKFSYETEKGEEENDETPIF